MPDLSDSRSAADEVASARAALRVVAPTPEVLDAVRSGLERVPDDASSQVTDPFPTLAVRRRDAL